ncbi:hypothetical protein JXA12_02550 [Candidatus Woesearchaeota archaeon]|nr:hypothetical protein [Candidatus Woesearchaeota archaeon]
MKPLHAPRKAQLEIQFNWLFVLVVGAVIIGFFITVINKQQQQADAEQATDLREHLDTAFITLFNNPDTIGNFTISKVDITFECEPGAGGLRQYYIQGAGPVDSTYDVIFTQAVLTGEEVFTWTKTWAVPFEVTVFTNMATDRTLFVFIDDGGSVKELYDELPGRYAKTLVNNLEGLATHEYHDTIIITSDDEALTGLDWTGRKARIIAPGADLDGSGDVTFQDEESSEKMPYLGRESLWGAIFTEDADTYRCTMDKAVARLKIVAAIMQSRSEAIADDLPHCGVSFGRAAGYFHMLKDLEGGFAAIAEDINSNRRALEQLQAITLRGSTCPYLY